MKTYFIILIIVAAFSSGGCITKKSFDLKVTVVPQTYNSVTSPDDLNKTAGVVTKRLENFFRIPHENIKLDVAEKQISLTISKIDTGKIGQIKDVITAYSKLEFWETYENAEIIGYLTKVNNMLREMGASASNEFKSQNPLFGILSPRVKDNGEPLPSCMIGLVNEKDTSTVNRYFKMDQVKALFPDDIKYYWSAKPYEYDQSKSLYELHAIKVTTGNRQAPLDGSAIISAKPVTGSGKSEVKIDLTMNSEGAKTWARITRENINRCIAVVYNGYVRSYPRVMSEISGGSTEITGDFTIGEATDLVNILKSGDLPFALKIVDEQIVERE